MISSPDASSDRRGVFFHVLNVPVSRSRLVRIKCDAKDAVSRKMMLQVSGLGRAISIPLSFASSNGKLSVPTPVLKMPRRLGKSLREKFLPPTKSISASAVTSENLIRSVWRKLSTEDVKDLMFKFLLKFEDCENK